MAHIVKLVREVAKRVTNRDVRLVDAGFVDELPQQCDNHLRRSVHIVGVSKIIVVDARHRPSAPNLNAADIIDLHDNLFSIFISGFTLAVRLVEVLEKSVPCGGFVFFAAQSHDCPAHHLVNYRLVRVIALPPVPVSGARPVGSIGIVYPDNATRVNPLGISDWGVCGRFIGKNRLFRRHALSEPHRAYAHRD